MTAPTWIAAAWDGRRLTLWRMADGRETELQECDADADALAPGDIAAMIARVASPWLGDTPTTCIACGPVGGAGPGPRAHYRSVPGAPLDGSPVSIPASDPRLDLRIVPGLKQARPPDVTEGEETAAAGFLAYNPDFDGVICLPGRHARWLQISAGEVVSFRTHMTGELLDLLTRRSTLRDALPDGWDEGAFLDAVGDGLSRPEKLASQLFALRADALLNGPDDAARGRLSGFLIGAELASARPYWLGHNIAVIGEEPLAGQYRSALAAQGVGAVHTDAAAMTRAGLVRAFAAIAEPAK